MTEAIAEDPINPVDPDLAASDEWDSPDDYRATVYVSGVTCSECDDALTNIPIPISDDFLVDEDYRIPLRCRKGHLVPFSFTVYDG